MNIMELLGRSRIKVEGEMVTEAGQPMIKWCPLFDKVRGIKEVTAESAAANMEFRIKNHGMFSPRRRLKMDTFVGFGASESMMTGLQSEIIDAAVTVCDGAGTVITANPDLVQGMGGYISGLVESDPIPEVIEGIRQMEGHILSPKDARIDQLEGAAYAAAAGYKRFAVTVADATDAEKLRELEKASGVRIMIIGVHPSGGSGHRHRLCLQTHSGAGPASGAGGDGCSIIRPDRLGQGAIGGEGQTGGAAASHQHHALAGAAGEKAAQAAGLALLFCPNKMKRSVEIGELGETFHAAGKNGKRKGSGLLDGWKRWMLFLL
jgi:putative methanogenesis marker protein 8